MNGTTWFGARFFSPNNPNDVNWKLVATGDFNQDSKPDLVWQYQGGGSDGLLAVWYMDDIPTFVVPALAGPGRLKAGLHAFSVSSIPRSPQ